MKSTPAGLVALIVALVGTAESALVAIESNSNSIQYSPAESWDAIEAPGSYQREAKFLLAQPEAGVILFTFPGELSTPLLIDLAV